MRRVQEEPGDRAAWNLVPLTPEYLELEHGGYVAVIEAALGNDEVRNIALSGSYGTGKSSVLREVARRQSGRVVELSLSTLTAIEPSKLDDSVPIQATTPTNRIQQEIVKQLLYREQPGKTPSSRFRRIERFRVWREVGIATLLGLVAALVFLLTGWTAQIMSVFTSLNDLGAWTQLMVWVVASCAALLVRYLLHGRFHIKQVSAGSATVTLDDNSVSYFDQYLDEIVYFFEVSDCDVVLFEDLDRFNDSHIFETLRALNTLLNASPQIKKPIRFVYAIKDSIFDHIGLEAEGRKVEPEVIAIDDPAQAEAVRANRTKFFDLVVPVVPFITHRSARNLAVQLLGTIRHDVATELLDMAAQFVPDMRLLKNVRNEFIVFRDRIFSGDGQQLKLSETDLFAMMLYKSTHLTDFEAIRLGTSKLDTLYKLSRELVTENIKRIEGERRSLRQRLAGENGAEARSAHLGGLLLAHLERTAVSASALGSRGRNGVTFSVDGSSKSDADLRSVGFWTAFVSADGDPELRQLMSGGHALRFSRSSLVAALGDPLDPQSWNQAEREALAEQIDEKTENIAFLRGADLGDLVRRPEFLVRYDESTLSLDAVAQALLKPGLAYQLIRAGYINRNFTLYTSTFHGDRVGPAATNFIIHHVERDLMDEHFGLAPDDVDAVVRERGRNALKEPALYNIAILDRLLATDVDAADIMIRSLIDFGDTQARFLQAYLAGGEQRVRFVERFTALSSRALRYLVSQVHLDDASRLELVDVALAHLSAQEQRTDAAVVAYLSEHYADFAVLRSHSAAPAEAERIGALFARASIKVARLRLLSRQVRPSFVSRDLYELTHENLAVAIDNADTVALDIVRAADETVYDYVLGDLSTYLDVTEGASATVETSAQFIPVIEDVVGRGAPRLGDVIERATPDCLVADLAAVSESAWPVLAEHRRFPATFPNISRYIASLGEVDAALAKVLTSAGEINGVEAADEESKAALAVSILAARVQLPSASLRAELVGSLSLDNYLGVDSVAAETGDLFALLLKHDTISDDAESYEQLATTDWPTRRAFIRESKEFANYMTPELVRPDLGLLLASDEIDAAIKEAVVAQGALYAEVADSRGLDELALFATQHGYTLPIDVVQKMARGGVSAQQIVLLIEPHLGAISPDQLLAVLQVLGGDYPKLAAAGYDKPRIPNTPADLALLERLVRDGIVSSYGERNASIKVNKKHK